MAGNIPQTTGLPLLVDSDIQNTLDFHAAATNFIKITTLYANEIATSYAHRYTLHTPDPITAEAQFFADLNNGTLNLTSQKGGGINPNTKGTITSLVDNLLAHTEVWSRNSDNTVISQTTANGLQFLAKDTVTKTTRWVDVPANMLDRVANATDNLSTAFSVQEMTNEFILYWINRFKTAHQAVVSAYRALVTDSTQDFFADFSDCIGNLTRLAENVDTSMLPLTDPTLDTINVIPSPYPACIDDKLDINTKRLSLDMYKRTQVLFRINLSKMIQINTTAAQAQGENLVTDILHYQRMVPLSNELNGYIGESLGNIAQMVYYVRTLPMINSQKVGGISFQAAIEDSLIQIDLLKNKIQQIPSKITTASVLSAQS